MALQSKLATMTSSFKEVLEVRTENLKESKNRQEMFSQGQVTSSLSQSAIKGFHSGSVLAASSAEDDERQYNGGDVAISFGGDPGQQVGIIDMTLKSFYGRISTRHFTFLMISERSRRCSKLPSDWSRGLAPAISTESPKRIPQSWEKPRAAGFAREPGQQSPS